MSQDARGQHDRTMELTRCGLAMNVAHLAGHGSIRLSALFNNPADPE